MPLRSARFPGPIGSIGSRQRTETPCNAAHPVYSRRERATRILSPGVSNTSTDARFRKPRMLRSEAPKPGAAGRKDLATEDLPRIRRDTTRKKGRVKRKIWRGCEFSSGTRRRQRTHTLSTIEIFQRVVCFGHMGDWPEARNRRRRAERKTTSDCRDHRGHHDLRHVRRRGHRDLRDHRHGHHRRRHNRRDHHRLLTFRFAGGLR